MKIGYARVSGATGQDSGLETQIKLLKEAGCEKIYSDKLTGTNTKRPELQAMIKSLRPDDCIVICKLDRLCRSLQDMFKTLEQIKNEGAGLVSLDLSLIHI